MFRKNVLKLTIISIIKNSNSLFTRTFFDEWNSSSSFSSEKSDLYKIYFYNKKSPSYFHWILFVINEKLLPLFFLLCLLIKTCYRKTIKRICARKIEFFTPDPIIFSYMNVNMNKCLKASPNWKTANTIFQAEYNLHFSFFL